MFTKIFFSAAVIAMFWPMGVLAGPLDTLQPGEWYEAPNTNMSAVDPCPQGGCSYRGSDGQYGVMYAWGGGAYDTTRDRLMVWGGGHNNYGGNEVYAFDITTMKWSRLTEPHPVDAADRSDGIAGSTNTTGYYHDFVGPTRTPASYHTTNALAYSPNADALFSLSGGSFGGNAVRRFQADSFSLANNTWKTDWITPPSVGNPRSMVAYDSVNGTIWYHAAEGAPLMEFNPLAVGGKGAWTQYGPNTNVTLYASPAIDTKRHKMVSIGGYTGARQFYVWDLNNPAVAPTIPTTSGNLEGLALEKVGAPGFAYDSVADIFVAWYGGTAVYTLNPDTWVWTRVNAASTNTVTDAKLARATYGTFGRFRYIPSKNAFVVVNESTKNVFFYKLSSGAGAVTSVSLTAFPASVAPGASATLTWVSTNASSCAASGAWSGTRSTANAVTLRPATTSTYTITCTGAGGSASQSAAITVQQ